jgi:outer membrane receptor for monomeric catechols
VLGNLASYTTGVRTSSFVDSQYGNFKKSDTPKHAATLWNKYEFQESRLKGFAVGGGVRYQSERVTDFAHGRNDRPQESREGQPGGGFVTPPIPSNTIYDLFFGYNRRLGGRDWSFQLNVRNLLDNQKLQAIGQPPPNSGITVPRTATLYLEPRDIRLSTTVRF